MNILTEHKQREWLILNSKFKIIPESFPSHSRRSADGEPTVNNTLTIPIEYYFDGFIYKKRLIFFI